MFATEWHGSLSVVISVALEFARLLSPFWTVSRPSSETSTVQVHKLKAKNIINLFTNTNVVLLNVLINFPYKQFRRILFLILDIACSM